MDDKEKEFLTNLSQMKDGKMVIEVPKSLMSELGGQTEVILEDLTNAQKATLLANQQAFEKMSAEDIARGQLSATENIQRDVAFLAATTRGRAVRSFKSAAEAAGITGEDSQKYVKELTDKLAKGEVNAFESFDSWAAEQIKSMKGKVKNVLGYATNDQKPMNVSSTEKKSVESKQTTDNSQRTIKHEISIKSSEALMDGWSRQIVKDPSTISSFLNSDADEYTSPPKN
jgi:uncharacterized protein YjbJ (UPF0337 family)